MTLLTGVLPVVDLVEGLEDGDLEGRTWEVLIVLLLVGAPPVVDLVVGLEYGIECLAPPGRSDNFV